MDEKEMGKVIKATLEAVKKEEIKNSRRAAFHNTELLLKNYNSLKEHMQCSVDSIANVDIELQGYDEVYIMSIRRSKVKTQAILEHIDSCMETLKRKQINKGQSEKFKVLELLYFEGKRYEEIAEELHCGESSVNRWRKEMVNDLSVLLFGVEGIRLDWY